MTDMEQIMVKALEGQFWGWSDNGYTGRVRNLNEKPLPKKQPVEALPDVGGISGRITCNAIVRAVSVASGVSFANLLSHRRKTCYVIARQAAMSLTYELTRLTTSQIGKVIGERNHSTVIHAIKSVDKNPERYESIIKEARRVLDESGLRQAA